MTDKHIVIIQGHPDPDGNRFCRSLANAYFKGAKAKGHEVKTIDIAQIKFPILRTQAEFMHGDVPKSIQRAQQLIQSAQHLFIIHPLWLGTMPAYLKAFLEQVFRPNFEAKDSTVVRPWERQISEKTAHIAITMGMPEMIYRAYFPAQGAKSVEGGILAFSGIKTIQQTLIGNVDSISDADRKQWLTKMELAGRSGL